VLLLLSVLRRQPAHGYRIVELLNEGSEGVFDLAEGTVYPALYRLERKGLVRSTWEHVSGRRRRVYRLTGRGRSELEQQAEAWRTFARAMEAVLR
jgi:PadR family transcriptional regulator PadR